VRAAGAANRAFVAAARRGRPERLKPAEPRGLFDLTPDDEQRMLREAFGDFARERLRPAALDADVASEPPDELLAQAAELGVTMLGVPEALGGAVHERSAVTTALVAEALAGGDPGLAVAVLAPAGVAAALAAWGDADQQAAYLPPFVGDHVPAAAVALLEPHVLADPLAPRTSAREARGGGHVLDGVKALVPRAATAELFVVAADLGGRAALFLVESGSDGVTIEPEPAMGLRAAATGRLRLDGVAVGPGALLGGGDPAVAAECVRRARLAWCAVAVGAAQAVLDYVIPYVNERHAFGEPISHRQAVAFAVADIAIEVEGMRLATYRAASRADAGKAFARDTAIARRLCTEKGMAIGSQGVQLLGGHGYVKEHPVERWYRDLRAAGVMEGALLV
ncbi:MAG TPA: acyl-CoA dehydrogenase family protein, partial [Solirubrobacteraceae bacterium]|nr:acyl-CoA dehydrogenase family protein [Solirubrobacteraceae bacterium]